MTTVNNWEEMIQKDLDDGKYNQICSNETTFKQYVFPIIQAAEKRGREEGIKEALTITELQDTRFKEGKAELRQLIRDIESWEYADDANEFRGMVLSLLKGKLKR